MLDDMDAPPSPASSSRPGVTLTFAQSLDARIGRRDGKQLILSGDESMAMTHRLRKAHDAVLVGVGTVLNDNPGLNGAAFFHKDILRQCNK
jgi:2,5-diamino-6-(ribosylamino)-4(3H)-pyrimidinone 5'-phosphate reductase